MSQDLLLFSLFLIFVGATVFSTVALYTRQSMLVAYMLLGVCLGPWGLRWVSDAALLENIGHIGIIFLLFLLGLHLQPRNLLDTLRKVSLVTLVSSLVFFAIGFTIGHVFGYPFKESLIIGAAAMFSSTIMGLKLLPTTVLHHQHTGEVMVAILLLQDLIAIAAILVLHSAQFGSFNAGEMAFLPLSLPALLIAAFAAERFILRRLFRRFDRVREYMFLLAIAWCLSLAILSNVMGLSAEIGAFIAGVSIASSPIAAYIAESLKPVRDFFLVLFFFAMGANFNIGYLPQVALPAALLAGSFLLLKPVVFRLLLTRVNEPKHIGWEVGVRLGQMSEFSILLVYVGLEEALLGVKASNLIQIATMFTFIVSSYWVVMRYPTPVALSDKLRRD